MLVCLQWQVSAAGGAWRWGRVSSLGVGLRQEDSQAGVPHLSPCRAPSLPCSLGRARAPPSPCCEGRCPVQGSEAPQAGSGVSSAPRRLLRHLCVRSLRTCSGPPASTAASSGPTLPSTASPGRCSSSWLSGTRLTHRQRGPGHSPPPSEPPRAHLQDGSAGRPPWVWKTRVTREWRAPRDRGSGGSGPVDVHLWAHTWSLLLAAASHTGGGGGAQPHSMRKLRPGLRCGVSRTWGSA